MMNYANEEALKSTDPNKKVGAVILNNTNSILARGHNAFPKNVEVSKERLIKETKLKYVVHAEVNAIINAFKHPAGCSIKGSVMFSTFYPCPTCAGAIINSGIKQVITYPMPENSSWTDNMKISEIMFKEAGVEVVLLHKPKNLK